MCFAALNRRESLSCFGAIYSFIHKGYRQRHVLWPSVLRELKHFRGNLVLLEVDLDLPWSTEVIATDAAEWARACGLNVGSRSTTWRP